MTLLLLRCLPSFSSLYPSPSSTFSYSFKPVSSSRQRKPISAKTPSRDRVIDFGKYKGKMLGTLPSKYLKWVSKNLRARDFEEWAKLADEVLQDPVYKDRLEWEFAEKILNGDDSRASRTENPVSHLLEISERFGWDNEDKAAWSRVDFALLGTSKGARIPRIGISDVLGSEKELGIAKIGAFRSRTVREGGILQQGSKVTGIKDRGSLEELGLRRQRKMGSLSTDAGVVPIEEVTSSKNSDAGLGSPRKMGSLGRNSRFGGSEELGSLERNSELLKGGKVWFRNGESKCSEAKRMGFSEGRKVGFLSKGVRFYDIEEEKGLEEDIAKGRREERRERQRLKRGMQLQTLRKDVGVKDADPVDDGSGIQKQSQKRTLNPFPGREALLRKANSLD